MMHSITVAGGNFEDGFVTGMFVQAFNHNLTGKGPDDGLRGECKNCNAFGNYVGGNRVSVGISAEVNTTFFGFGGGGGTYGTNYQYIEGEGGAPYTYGTQTSTSSSGFNPGAGIEINIATTNDNSAWTGLFTTTDFTLGPLTISHFSSPGGGWSGISIGLAIGRTPVGASQTYTNYELLQ